MGEQDSAPGENSERAFGRGAVVHGKPQSAMHRPIQPDAAATVPTLINAIEWLDRGETGGTKGQLIAAFIARRPPPPGCPAEACHQFWISGTCAY